jgi:hypothetical protein
LNSLHAFGKLFDKQDHLAKLEYFKAKNFSLESPMHQLFFDLNPNAELNHQIHQDISL